LSPPGRHGRSRRARQRRRQRPGGREEPVTYCVGCCGSPGAGSYGGSSGGTGSRGGSAGGSLCGGGFFSELSKAADGNEGAENHGVSTPPAPSLS
jgi:hypothetical protein